MTSSKLKAMMGGSPVASALKSGAIKSPIVELNFAEVSLPQTAFKRVVRDLEFDIAELAIVTFLMAKARGVPITLLPAVITARFQHPYLVYNGSLGTIAPKQLAGLRVGIRSFTVTTVTWLRGMLAKDYDVDIERIKWVTFEDAHVAGFADPPGVERAAEGKDLEGMLRAGEIDAAILGAPTNDPQFPTLFPDPAKAAKQWQAKHQAIQLNHLVVVKDEIANSQPDTVCEVYRMLCKSKIAAGLGSDGNYDMNPFGINANRRNLETAIEYVHALGLIPDRYGVDELFHDAVRDQLLNAGDC